LPIGTSLEIIWFIFLGLLGGFTYILVEKAEKLEDLIDFYAFKRYILGGIVGLIYHIGYSESSFPNSIMCFVSGYASVTFIQSIIKRRASYLISAANGDVANV